MLNPFTNINDAFAPLSESVQLVQVRDGETRRAVVEGIVIVGNTISGSAGAVIHSETADRYTVSICDDALGGADVPRFGDGVSTALGYLVVQQVTRGPNEYTLRCTRQMRGGLPQ